MAPPPTWPRAVMWMVIVFLLVASALYVFKSILNLPGDMMDRTGRAGKSILEGVRDVASAFKRGTVTTSFASYATTLHPTHFYQFATLRQQEIFTRSDQTTLGNFPLPEVIIEARAPVEFTYYLDLNSSWDFVTRDGVIYVMAPPIKYNKPSVDASLIQYEVRKDSVLRKTTAAQEELKKTISSLVQIRARENIPLVRETARKQTTDFVENWLRRSFSDGSNYPVKVFFPGEKLPPGLQFRTNAPTGAGPAL